VELARNPQVNQVYADCHLKHIGTNIDSKDAQFSKDISRKLYPKPQMRKAKLKEAVLQKIELDIETAISKGQTDFIVLIHDVNELTFLVLREYVDKIKNTITALGHVCRFITTRAEALQLMQSTAI
jgi:hypothetical protein